MALQCLIITRTSEADEHSAQFRAYILYEKGHITPKIEIFANTLPIFVTHSLPALGQRVLSMHA